MVKTLEVAPVRLVPFCVHWYEIGAGKTRSSDPKRRGCRCRNHQAGRLILNADGQINKHSHNLACYDTVWIGNSHRIVVSVIS